jgi:acyl-CoA reductase-like NAD-dependent aldehyde dehydrogenase
VVFDIAAWNYPLLIAVNVVLPALAAGNTVLLKHSTRTPLCGRHFENAFRQYPGLVNHLVLTHEDTAVVIQDPQP